MESRGSGREVFRTSIFPPSPASSSLPRAGAFARIKNPSLIVQPLPSAISHQPPPFVVPYRERPPRPLIPVILPSKRLPNFPPSPQLNSFPHHPSSPPDIGNPNFVHPILHPPPPSQLIPYFTTHFYCSIHLNPSSSTPTIAHRLLCGGLEASSSSSGGTSCDGPFPPAIIPRFWLPHS